MKNLEQLKREIEINMNETVNWIYSEEGDNAGSASSDLVCHIKPIIEEKIDEAFQLGRESIKN